MTISPITTVPLFITDLTPTEEWVFKQPLRGDHIRVDRGLYYHHGIYVADDEVIHFSSEDDDNILGSSNLVLRTDRSGFLRNGRLEVKVYTEDEIDDLYPVEDIIAWAQACLGDEGYHLVFNNCEHFANYCTLGRHHSGQVNRVLNGGRKMGLWDRVKGAWDGFWGNSSSSSRETSSTSTVYEPDKVRIAEIEANAKIRLAGMEQDRIRLYTDTQKELLEFNAQMEAALLEARLRGEQAIQQAILDMMREANILAEQRLTLIETAGMDVIKQIEGYYELLGTEIDKDRFSLATERLPQLFEILDKYEEGTPKHSIYLQEIQDYKKFHADFITERIRSLKERQSQVMASYISGKEQINAHINLLVEKRMEQIGLTMQAQMQIALPTGQDVLRIEQRKQITSQKLHKLLASEG